LSLGLSRTPARLATVWRTALALHIRLSMKVLQLSARLCSLSITDQLIADFPHHPSRLSMGKCIV
jgi:hypothetical protein